MKQLYICKIHIENYRNFKLADFELSDKQVIIGENNSGKSNLLRALQLILDQSFSDEDRQLEETDFHDSIENPMENKQEIRIDIYIDNYMHIKNVLCQLSDATVDVNGKKLLKISYKFFPEDELVGKVNYTYTIFKGDDEAKPFTHEDRKYLNMRVIKAIRDVENEMRNSRLSPLTKLVKQKYDIKSSDIKTISEALKATGANTLDLPELTDLQKKIHKLFNSIISFGENEFEISLGTMDIDATRILYALKPLIDKRDAANTSLGVNNILYISLMLLLIADDTIKTYLSTLLYEELREKENGEMLEYCYEKSEKGYILKKELEMDCLNKLYEFMYEENCSNLGVTILAIEEPEAHLHPIYQRLLYKYVVNNSHSPVIITTHSTHISCVAPIDSIIHLVYIKNSGTKVKTTAKINLSDREKDDLARYIDVKRGELYLAKGIIFVEGITEEYMIPSFAASMGYELDRFGIVVCNINSFNFWPYKKFADMLGIPNVVITDGDYYHCEKNEKKWGDMWQEGHQDCSYAGNERILDICSKFINTEALEELKKKDWVEQDEYFNSIGFFVGMYTFEIDMFAKCNEGDSLIFSRTFNELTSGGEKQKTNFLRNMKSKLYTKCLSIIESSHSQVGKGRFAQRLSSTCTETMIPNYVKGAIKYICERVESGVE